MRGLWRTGGVLAVGVVIGLLIAPVVRPVTSQAIPGHLAELPLASKGEGGGAGETTRRSTGREAMGKKPAEPRISIPLREVRKILKARLGTFQLCQFVPVEKTGDSPAYEEVILGECLSLLNASEAERADVAKAFKTLEERLREAEKSHVKVAAITPGQIRLDISGMQSAIVGPIAQARSDLKAALGDERGEVLDESIAWNAIYGGANSDNLNFQIKRSSSNSGTVTTWIGKDNGAAYGYSVREVYADDGISVPADKVFGNRWQPWLSGVTLLPVDEK